MLATDSLRGVSVLIAGAGLAGLVVARELQAQGSDVLVVEARDRVGGRILTVRDGFAAHQHSEAGGDLIKEGQTEIRRLATQLGLHLVRILRGGFSGIRQQKRGGRLGSEDGWDAMRRQLAWEIRAYILGERRWDSAVAQAIARESVASWLDRVDATVTARATALGMRGF